MSCPVCYEHIENVIVALNSCKHAFCKTCIEAWSRQSSVCPLCRGRFSSLNYSSLGDGEGHRRYKVVPVPERDFQVGSAADDAFEVDDDDLPCLLCGGHERADQLLLCDGCDGPFHTFCLDPPLPDVPEGDWFCSSCLPSRSPQP
eukprot:EG_transcript_42679